METVPIGSTSLFLAYIQQVPLDKIQGLTHIDGSKYGQIWLLPEKVLCRTCFVPDLSVSPRPGHGHLFLRFHDANTLWAIELSELERLQERAQLILNYAEMLYRHISSIPTYQNYREFQNAVAKLPNKQKSPCKKEPHTFDEFITHFDEALSRAQAVFDFPAGNPVSARNFEYLLAEYRLWDELHPRIKGFLRNHVQTISADGTHEHKHPVGLTEGHRAALKRVAVRLAEAMQNPNAADGEGDCA